MTASLCELLTEIIALPAHYERVITGLTLDSRSVTAGNLFFARAGSRHNGADFIDAAIAQGAAAVVAEAAATSQRVQYEWRAVVPLITVPELGRYVGEIAARFQGYPARRLINIVGVTGTNGKTSLTHLLAHALHHDAAPCAVIGTLGVGFPGQLAPTTHTTPDALALQAMISDLTTRGARRLVMEVSSHALDQGRVAGLGLDVAVFTNLTRDHLDYHGDMSAYGQAKRRLFHMPDLKSAVLNTDDAFGRALLHELASGTRAVGYGFVPQNHEFQVCGEDLTLARTGVRMRVTTPWGRGILESPWLGRFNATNLLAALATLGMMGIPLDAALLSLAHAPAVAGRMEKFGGGAQPLVVVDYAHTPDALEQVLHALREPNSAGRLWCVFGCGGARDRGKRPLMGEIAARLADLVIVTTDNPRSEDPAAIIQEILAGVKVAQHVRVIPERAAAIHHAITHAAPTDVVLVAGKGHEDYQQIGAERLPFRDRDVVQQALQLRKINQNYQSVD